MKIIDEYYATPIVDGVSLRKFYHLKKEVDKDDSLYEGEYVSMVKANGFVDINFHRGQFRFDSKGMDKIYPSDYYLAVQTASAEIR